MLLIGDDSEGGSGFGRRGGRGGGFSGRRGGRGGFGQRDNDSKCYHNDTLWKL